MNKPSRHVFVCVNERATGGRPSCGRRGTAILEALTTALATDPELWSKVAVTGCQCLGPCFDGANMVIYPEAVWYCGVTAEDTEEIVDSHLRRGIPVGRLTEPSDTK